MANSQFEQSLYILMVIMFTVNGLFLVVGNATGVDLITGSESFSFLPREVNELNIDGVTGTTVLDVNADSSLATGTDLRNVPFLGQEVNTINVIISGASNLVFTSYIGIMNIIGIPDDIQFILIVVISMIQIIGFAAILLKVIQSLPIIGSGG